MKDYYEILQVSPNAEPEVIAVAYKRLARKYHPDADASPDATERMRKLNEAYEVLSDPAKRAEYDALLGRARPHAASERQKHERTSSPPPSRSASPRAPSRHMDRDYSHVLAELRRVAIIGAIIFAGLAVAAVALR